MRGIGVTEEDARVEGREARSSLAGSGREGQDGGTMDRREFLAKGGAFAFAAAVTGPGLTILSGCGGGDSSSGPLAFMQFYGPGGDILAQSKWFVDMVEAWNKENETKIKLQYVPTQEYVSGTKLQTAFSAGEGPDVFLLSAGDFLRYYNGGVLEDLTPFMQKGEREDFYANVMATRMAEGKIYALLMEVGAMAMYYSVKAFEKAGLSEADIPKTWDELLNVAGKVRTKDMFGVLFETLPGYYQNFTWYPFMWQGGGDAVARDGKTSDFDSQGAVQALAFWQEAIESGVAPRQALGDGGSDVVANIASGYCAIQNFSSPGVSALGAGAPDFEYGVFKLPIPSGGSYTTDLGGWAFAANSKGKNPEEAAKFCVWALASQSKDSVGRGVEWITEKGMTAPRRSVAKAADAQGFFDSGPMKVFKEDVFPGGRAEPRYPPEVYKPISDAIQACQLDGADPTEQANRAAKSIETYLKGYSGAKIL